MCLFEALSLKVFILVPILFSDMYQTSLSFQPRVKLPEVPSQGVAVAVPAAEVKAEPNENDVKMSIGAEQKPRRELSATEKKNVVKYFRSHSVDETLKQYPEVSRATLFRMALRCENILNAFA